MFRSFQETKTRTKGNENKVDGEHLSNFKFANNIVLFSNDRDQLKKNKKKIDYLNSENSHVVVTMKDADSKLIKMTLFLLGDPVPSKETYLSR